MEKENYREKRMRKVELLLNDTVSRCGMAGRVAVASAHLYRRAIEKGLTAGRPLSEFAPALVYFVCRLGGLPHTAV